MARYSYPCVFIKEKEGGYSAVFPDWEKRFGACTCGDSWPHVLYMAQDLLNLMCYCQEEDGLAFPPAGKAEGLDGLVRMVEADTDEYGKFMVIEREHGDRFRMAEKARRRYLYPRMPQYPEEMADVGVDGG